MNDKELIEGLRNLADNRLKKAQMYASPEYLHFVERYRLEAGVMTEAADALAARQPSVIDRDVAIDAIAGGTISVPGGYGVLHGDDAANIVDAIIQHAAVPDAATDELARIKPLFENLSREYPSECNKRVKAEAERDAALAAIERVRAEHRKFTYYELEDSCPDTSEEHREERHHESDEIGEFYCEDMPTGDVVCDLCRDADGERMDWPCPTVAALDGAPEPEVKP